MARRDHEPVSAVRVILPPRGSSLCTGSIILGILAFLICWVPLIGAIGMPLALLGLIMGALGIVVSLLRSGAGMAMGIVGAVICGVSLFVAFTVNGAIVHGFRSALVKPAGTTPAIVPQDSEPTAQDQQDMARERWRERQRDAAEAKPEPAPAPADATTPPAGVPAPTEQPGTSVPPAGEPSAPATPESPEQAPRRRPKAAKAPTPPLPTPAPASPAAPVDDVVVAPNVLTFGDLELKVRAAVVEKPHLVDTFNGSASRGQQSALVISLALTNTSKTRKIDLESWSAETFSPRRPSLTDNFGNTYRQVSYGFGLKVLGQASGDSIHPGKVIGDVIVFETPLDNMEYLELRLPAQNFGETGTLRIRIPAGRLTR